jgi:EpsI family protein
MPGFSTTTQRAAVLIATFLVSWLAVAWFKKGISAEGEKPSFWLSEIPLLLGEWSGEEVEMNDETVQVLNAYDFINRAYLNKDGQRVVLHLAIWINDGHVAPAPHHPTVCYPAAGWSIINRSDTQLTSSGDACPMELIEFQKEGRVVVTGHWYELGSAAFTTSEGFLSQRFKLMGSQMWPYTVKYLVQTDVGAAEQAEPVLKGFAQVVREAFRQLAKSQGG